MSLGRSASAAVYMNFRIFAFFSLLATGLSMPMMRSVRRPTPRWTIETLTPSKFLEQQPPNGGRQCCAICLADLVEEGREHDPKIEIRKLIYRLEKKKYLLKIR